MEVTSVDVVDAPEYTYDGHACSSQTVLEIQLDTQGCVLYYFQTFVDPGLLDSLNQSLKESQYRPHAFGLLPPDPEARALHLFEYYKKLSANFFLEPRMKSDTRQNSRTMKSAENRNKESSRHLCDSPIADSPKKGNPALIVLNLCRTRPPHTSSGMPSVHNFEQIRDGAVLHGHWKPTKN